ncbi:LysR family transcriptional regulator for bpeEF and oprC, partial [Actimicrobium sp. GrIS 1.19]|uniref:substrate binding domain-containing protein n=1 Tax=Actimicrobium sp. GrIS 1.19 TaxID=3071708 RepID=UPI002DFDC624|nr:LysR family transcriptional regulator for bpeEF and oprC [Actimicrobium sp. GrIS 1.19]
SGCTTLRLVIVFLVAGSLLPNDRLHKIIYTPLADAEQSLDRSHGEPEGVLHIDMPVAYGRLVVMPIVAAFKVAHPKVALRLQFTDRISDLIDDRLDVIFRLGELGESSMVARRFDQVFFGAYASSAFVQRLGRVAHPDDLREAERLCFTLTNGRPFAFRFERDGDVVHLPAGSGLVSNDIEGIIEAAALGMGVAFIPTFLAASVRANLLLPLLPDWRVVGPPVHLLYPTARHLSSRVRAFVDFAVANAPGRSG